jgi:hypothetical protein
VILPARLDSSTFTVSFFMAINSPRLPQKVVFCVCTHHEGIRGSRGIARLLTLALGGGGWADLSCGKPVGGGCGIFQYPLTRRVRGQHKTVLSQSNFLHVAKYIVTTTEDGLK